MADIIIDYTNLMADAVGKKHGVGEEELKALAPKAKQLHADITRRRKKGDLPFYDLPYRDDSVREIEKAARALRKKFKTMVVLGIGGSALGTMALFSALKPANHNTLSGKKRQGMRLFVADNIDPDHFDTLISSLKLKETVFNVISKSGSTAETMSQFMIIVTLLKKKFGKQWKRHLVITTDPKAGTLRPIAEAEKIKSFEVPDGVGGRFTVFTPVSLLPAACAGIDIKKLLVGAARMEERTRHGAITNNPAYLFAASHYLLDSAKGKKMSVMMPYANSLYLIADWYRQMWAESLGKAVDRQGKKVHVGPTPIKALGATDQHSQVQLYVEGPFDKVVVFLEVERFRAAVPIPAKGFDALTAVSYLGGSSLAELLAIEKEGTEYALTSNKRPNMTITLPAVDEESVGQLLFMLEVATLFAGGLYNIDPLNQPGVEFGKQYAYAMMGRDGFEEKKKIYDAERVTKRRKV